MEVLQFLYLASEKIQSYKAVCDYICSVLDREVRELKYLSRSQFFPSYSVATRLNYSSDTASRLNFKK